MYDLVILNATIINSMDSMELNIGIKDGKVASFFKGMEFESKQILDATGKIVLPGFVDMHFHSRVPGNTKREDFDTATMAAASSGVTTLVEMPICNISPNSVANLNTRKEYCEEKAVIDFGFYGAGATKNSKTAKELADAGVLGFKIFLHKAPVGRESEFADLCAIDNSEILKSLIANKESGLITCVHPEDDSLIRGMIDNLDVINHDYTDHLKSRIPEAEELSVLGIGLMSKITGARVHACHLSSKNSVDAIKYLKKIGVDTITSETCPHYMLFDDEFVKKNGTFAKVNPPIKESYHGKALINALEEDIIDVIASDHAPFLSEEKTTEDFLNAPSGMPSIEFFGPSMLDKCIDGKFSYSFLSKKMSEAPAKLLGLYPQKGCLKVGSDADFVVFDPSKEWVVDINNLYTKSRLSALPFQGMRFKGKIESTYVRGQAVYSYNKILVEEGYGMMVKRR